MWCGVELDRPEGKNNGSKHGIRYFTCEPGYGVFVPVERVERDTRPSRSRPSSRPSSRPNSRPSSADRGRRGQEEGFRVKPAVVQQELARLVQHVPVGDHMTTRRKMAASAVASSRQPMKAFAQTKDDTTIGSKPSTLQPVPVRGMHRAASSENLRGARMNSKPVKKSSSEQSLKGGNTLPRTAKPSKRHPRPQSVSSIDKQWPRVSTPKVDDEESGSASLDGVVSSSDSSSPDGTPSSANTGFLVSTYPLNFGLSTHASQFAEQEKHNSGEVSRVPAPNGGLGKVSDSATLSHPLSHIAGVKGDLTLQAILPLLKELMDQNQKLMQRQGIYCALHVF